MSYSLHLGSDKNKKASARKSSKTNRSGTTSLANNAIQNAKGLSKVAHHNYGKYEDKERDIDVLVGSDSLEKDVMRIYKEEFEQARISYNDKQTREDRKIKDYFKHISDNAKSDLACEIIIELGDKAYWDKQDDNYKRKMSEVFKEQIKDLEMLVPKFKIASAIVHYDETSPHMHIVGVPIKENCKTGMSKQVGKGAVFTKESLRRLQDKMRTLCINSFNKVYKEQKKLKRKMKGRNIDYLVSEMGNYQEKIKQADKQRERIEKLDKKSKDLDINSKEVRDKLKNLKTTMTSKEKYILSKQDLEDMLVYIENVSNINNDYKDMKELSADLEYFEDVIRYNEQENRDLFYERDALTVRVEDLSKKVKQKDIEIEELKQENTKLRGLVNFFENAYNKIKKFFRNKIFSRDEKESQIFEEVIDEFYDKEIFNDKDIIDIYEEKKAKDIDEYSL